MRGVRGHPFFPLQHACLDTLTTFLFGSTHLWQTSRRFRWFARLKASSRCRLSGTWWCWRCLRKPSRWAWAATSRTRESPSAASTWSNGWRHSDRGCAPENKVNLIWIQYAHRKLFGLTCLTSWACWILWMCRLIFSCFLSVERRRAKLKCSHLLGYWSLSFGSFCYYFLF